MQNIASSKLPKVAQGPYILLNHIYLQRIPIVYTFRFRTNQVLKENEYVSIGDVTANRVLLKSSYLISTMEKKTYKCEQCHYSTAHKSHFDSHVRAVHNKIKAFKCDKCEYATTLNSTLNKHVRAVHLGIKPFKCDQCNYATAHKSHFDSHIKAVHNKIKSYKCNRCDYAAALNSTLNKHIRAVHEDIKPFKCEQCNYASAHKSHFDSHVRAVHNKITKSKQLPNPLNTHNNILISNGDVKKEINYQSIQHQPQHIIHHSGNPPLFHQQSQHASPHPPHSHTNPLSSHQKSHQPSMTCQNILQPPQQKPNAMSNNGLFTTNQQKPHIQHVNPVNQLLNNPIPQLLNNPQPNFLQNPHPLLPTQPYRFKPY